MIDYICRIANSVMKKKLDIAEITQLNEYYDFPGADPNETLPDGSTHLSDMLSDNGEPEIVRQLINYGADLNKKVKSTSLDTLLD